MGATRRPCERTFGHPRSLENSSDAFLERPLGVNRQILALCCCISITKSRGFGMLYESSESNDSKGLLRLQEHGNICILSPSE